MSVAAWDGFLNDQSNWPAASRIGNATGATTARDTLGDKTFVKHKRMSQEERHLQILQAAVKIIATKGFWGMSLQNISDELGITEAALYHYISSKDDLLNMVLSECYDTIDADEYNAVTAAIVDADGHRVYYYPRYCLNIVLYNLQRPELVQLYSVLNGEALNPSHPAHDFFIGRHLRQWEMICSMNWLLPPDVDEERFYDLYTLAMSAMDGLQYRWLGDNSMNLLEQWMSISDIIFPDSECRGFRDPRSTTRERILACCRLPCRHGSSSDPEDQQSITAEDRYRPPTALVHIRHRRGRSREADPPIFVSEASATSGSAPSPCLRPRFRRRSRLRSDRRCWCAGSA